LVGTEYPAGYSNLVQKTLGAAVHKRETRTDWRRRPLSSHQLSYALEDVEHLEAIRDTQQARLEKLGRSSWIEEEMAAWLDEINSARVRPRWHRMTGISSLSPRQLAVVRELYDWRDSEAQRRDRSPRQVLRDDLIVELARRGNADENQIGAVRGFERRNLRNVLPLLAEAVRRGLELPENECPQPVRRESRPPMSLISQFLQTALASVCREKQLASALVASGSDIRELVTYRLNMTGKTDTPPSLARGWRLLEDLLAGKIAIRINDPRSEAPLSLHAVDE
jgi:ribonuclease D